MTRTPVFQVRIVDDSEFKTRFGPIDPVCNRSGSILPYLLFGAVAPFWFFHRVGLPLRRGRRRVLNKI